MTKPASSTLRGWRGWLLPAGTAVLVLVLALSVALAIVMAGKVRAQDRLDADRRDALGAAEQFALRMDNFAAPSVKAYEDGIEELLTTKGKADFAQVKPIIGQVYTAAQPQAQQPDKKSGKKHNKKHGKGQKQDKEQGDDQDTEPPTGSIVLAGVSDVSADSATVLVAHDSAVSGTGKALHFRWTVSLRKVGGTWLVDGLPPEVGGAAQ